MAIIIKTPGPSDDFHSGWDDIIEDQIVTVKERKQMRVNGLLELSGLLVINGTVVLD